MIVFLAKCGALTAANRSTSSILLRRMLSTNVPNDIEFSRVNQVGVIVLNRPKQLNALNDNMSRMMFKQLDEFERDESVRAIVVKGAGEAAFCAGGDVKSIRELIVSGKPSVEFFKKEYVLNERIAKCNKPYMALISGITMGGGVGLSVHGRYRIATEKTLFAMPETAIGFFADVGGSYFLPRLQGHLGLYLAMTGHRLKSVDVKRAGIATHFMSSARLLELEKALYATNDLSVERLDQLLAAFDETASASEKQPVTSYDTARIEATFAETSVEAIVANLERDGSEWATTQLKLLAKMSPTSLKVTVRQMIEGKRLATLHECLDMEYRLAQRFAATGDFCEGVRALLVDKGDKPKWSPPTLQEVDNKLIDWYFEPQPSDDHM